jgi:hypothetical protein
VDSGVGREGGECESGECCGCATEIGRGNGNGSGNRRRGRRRRRRSVGGSFEGGWVGEMSSSLSYETVIMSVPASRATLRDEPALTTFMNNI